MRADADADAGAETPLESHLPKRPKRCDMIRHDITRAYSRFTNTQRTSAFSRSADFRFLAHEPSLDLGHSRFKDKPDCVVLPADRICALALLLYLHRRLQSGVVSCEAPSMGLNALASLAATCVWDAADQVVHAGLHYWYASMPLCIFMHAGLLAGRRALGEVCRTGVGQVPSLSAAGSLSCRCFCCCRLTER